MTESITSWIVTKAVICFILFGFYALFIWGPMSFYTDADCLRKGYPKSVLTVGLERYCIALDGSVHSGKNE